MPEQVTTPLLTATRAVPAQIDSTGTWPTRCIAGLSDDQKRLFDAVHAMREDAWRSFDRRRGFEWKLSFALWSALGAYMAALIKLHPATGDPALRLGSVVVTLGLIAVHWYWTRGLGRANRVDQDVALRFYDVRSREVLGVSEEQFQSLIGLTGKRIEELTGSPRQWSHLSQLSITVILGLAVVLVTSLFG
jgi:hypothetical protein